MRNLLKNNMIPIMFRANSNMCGILRVAPQPKHFGILISYEMGQCQQLDALCIIMSPKLLFDQLLYQRLHFQMKTTCTSHNNVFFFSP